MLLGCRREGHKAFAATWTSMKHVAEREEHTSQLSSKYLYCHNDSSGRRAHGCRSVRCLVRCA